MNDPEAARALARRMLELRQQRKVTQQQVADALAVSTPLISSWEKRISPDLPPVDRLRDYAMFFATVRSVEGKRARLLNESELTILERQLHTELVRELLGLRVAVVGSNQSNPELSDYMNNLAASPGAMPWRFPRGEIITIVCARLPLERQAQAASDPREPSQDEYQYADLKSVMELYGHLRAVNPDNQVNIRVPDSLGHDDLSAHLVLLGGVDWNRLTRDILQAVGTPIRQSERPQDEDIGAFEVHTENKVRTFKPTFYHDRRLAEDVAQFLRAPNPYNKRRTLTVCNGMFASGVLGVVRALTDTRLRDRNAAYLHRRSMASDTLSILCRVRIIAGTVSVPDWTLADDRLHEWPEAEE